LIFAPHGRQQDDYDSKAGNNPTMLYTSERDQENTFKMMSAKRKARDLYLTALRNTSLVLTDLSD